MGLFTDSLRLAAACALACALAGGAVAQTTPTEPQPNPPVNAQAPSGSTAQNSASTNAQTGASKPAEVVKKAAYTQFTGKIVSIGTEPVYTINKDPTTGKVIKDPITGEDKKTRVEPAAANFDAIKFAPDADGGGSYPTLILQVATEEARKALAVGARPGDRILIAVDDPVKPTQIVSVAKLTRPIDGGQVGWAVFWAALVLTIAVVLAAGGNPVKFLVGHDGRLSNSQCQMALWFGVVAIAYGAALVLRVTKLGPDFIGGIGLTDHVLMLTGLSGLTFGGAKIIRTQKQDAAAAKAKADADTAEEKAKTASATAQVTSTIASTLPVTEPAAPATLAAQVNAQKDVEVEAEAKRKEEAARQKAAETPTAAEAPRAKDVKPHLKDLFTNAEDEADIGDFQMIMISLASAGIFAFACWDYLSALVVVREMMLPDVDPALLAAFGLGQGTYLVKKAALPVDKG